MGNSCASPWPFVASVQGVTGLVGPSGLEGPQGQAGLEGPTGVVGNDGTSVRTGYGAPTTITNLGDTYIDLSEGGLYGPLTVSSTLSYGTISWNGDLNTLTSWFDITSGSNAYAVNNAFVYSVSVSLHPQIGQLSTLVETVRVPYIFRWMREAIGRPQMLPPVTGTRLHARLTV